jgi:hypothetical protein
MLDKGRVIGKTNRKQNKIGKMIGMTCGMQNKMVDIGKLIGMTCGMELKMMDVNGSTC